MPIKDSELILNPDGSIYHLNLHHDQISDTIILVGDPDRVNRVTEHFQSIEFKIQKREFHTQTGTFNGKRITVISTGIGTDNIDIVMNELDALANIDLSTREIKNKTKSLEIIRIGTSGSIQKDIPVDSFLISEYGVGFDGLLHFYKSETIQDKEITEAIFKSTNWFKHNAKPYVVKCDEDLFNKITSDITVKGITATNVGFYGPQGRVLRLQLQDNDFNEKLTNFIYKGMTITNMEMETAAIYGLSKLMGHKSLSMNAIVANRETGEFTSEPYTLVDNLIEYTLKRLTTN
jgi:uridine phosphorylase